MNYDTEEGILEHTESLERFQLLSHERHAAGYTRGERLQEWVILGHWWLDACGNTMLTQDVPSHLIYDAMDKGKTILPKETFFKNWVFPTSWSPAEIVPFSARCSRCEEAWGLADAHTAIPTRPRHGLPAETRRWMHPICMGYELYDNEKLFFEEVFADAGLEPKIMTSIPNDYWPSVHEYDSVRTPWFFVETKVCRFKIGWRKRVISIHWELPLRDGAVLFKEEKTTQDPFMIHAWGKEKAVQYIRALHEQWLTDNKSR